MKFLKPNISEKEYLAEAENAADLLRSKKINFVLIKSLKEFPYSDSDIDILIPNEKELTNFSDFLKSKKYAAHKIFREPNKLMLRDLNKKISLHLHKKVSWNGLEFLDKNLVLRARKNRKNLPVTSDEDDLLINCAHLFFENYEISSEDYSHIKLLLNKKLNWSYMEKQAQKFGWFSVFQKVISDVRFIEKNFDEEYKFPHRYNMFTNLFYLNEKLAYEKRNLLSRSIELVKAEIFYISAKTWRKMIK